MVVVDFDRASFDRGNVKRNSAARAEQPPLFRARQARSISFPSTGKNCEIALSTSTIPNAFSRLALGEIFP